MKDNLPVFVPPAKTRSASDLSDVKVVRRGKAEFPFSLYFRHQFLHFPLMHPSKDERRPAFKGTAASWRLSRGVWVTFGELALSFYSSTRLQVRATLTMNSRPLRRHDSRPWKSELSWHLDETGVVLPALIESIVDFDYRPLKSLKLFKDPLPDTPDQPVYAWTAIGIAAPESQ